MKRVWSGLPTTAEMRRNAWQAFVSDPAATRNAEHVRGLVGDIRCVVDAGCGGGQELLPYMDAGLCVGIDLDRDTLVLGRTLMRERGRADGAAFVCGRLEALPLRPRCADIVLCRVVLQRVPVLACIAEMSRLLRAGGVMIVMFHHQRYYYRKIRHGLRSGDLRPIVHGLRVLTAGAAFHLSGAQRRLLGTSETFLTRRRIRRVMGANGLDLVGQMPDGSSYAPHWIFRRRD